MTKDGIVNATMDLGLRLTGVDTDAAGGAADEQAGSIFL